MKIEIGESLACSYLRHVKHCWLVQANWKASEHWQRRQTDAELDALYLEMKRRFDSDSAVFKQTSDAAQFLKQSEIDVVGVDLEPFIVRRSKGQGFIGVSEAAERLEVSRTTVYDGAARGGTPYLGVDQARPVDSRAQTLG